MMDNRGNFTELQQLNKSSETPNASEKEEKQHPQDGSLPSTSISTSTEAIVLPSTSSKEFIKITTTTRPDEILATTDNSEKTYIKKVQNEKNKNQFRLYKKRNAVQDTGTEYEYLMCAYYALKLCFDENVVDFEITTNCENYGDFGDVAMKVTFLDKSSHHFLMQIKHTEQVRGITDKMLSSKEGNFSLFKYFESFQKLQGQNNISCILFTNRNSQLNDKSTFKLEDESIIVNQCQPHNVNHLLIDTVPPGDETAHIFSFEHNNQNSQKFEKFFKSFYLFTNQMSNHNMQSHIDELLYEKFGCKVDFIGFMRQWCKGRFVLNKHDVIVKLAELILSPFIQEIPKNANESLSDKATLLKEAIMQFEVTLVKDGDANDIAKIWTGETADLEIISKASLKYGLSSTELKNKEELASKEFTKVLWYLNKVPLIVKYDKNKEKEIRAAIELLAMETDKKKLVLVGLKSKESLSKWKIFESLYDLRTTPLYEEIIAAFKVSLQGRQSIHLEKIINPVTETAKVIEIKELFIMLEKDLSIGEQLPSLPVVYIPRILSCDNIFVNKSGRNRLIYNPRTLSEHYNFEEKVEAFDRSFANRTETIVNISVDEDKAFSTFNNPVNIVTGKPGIGKSTLMTYLSHQCPPDYWCVRVSLIKFSKFFSEEHSTEEIMNEFLKDEGPFFNKVNTTFQQNKKIYLLLDGLDEIDANCLETVLTFIKNIASKGIRVWISTREHLKDKLSNYFKVSPITIKELTKENQEEYIKQRLCHCDKSEKNEGVIYTEDKAKEITRLFASVSVSYNAENILGVPLLLFIITENFRNDKSNFEKIKTEDTIALTKMYKIFFEGKKKHLYKKAGAQNEIILDTYLDNILEVYQLPAIEASASELLPKLGLDSKTMSKSQQFLEKIRHTGDPLGIISQVVGEKNKFRAVFSHQSFAEYFACVWLKENQHKLELIKDSFFEDNNENLRLTFDIMLAEDKPLHLAVLYKNPDQVKKYINHYAEKDEGGRTALHLISSYSRNDSILRIDSNFERIPKDIKIYQLLLKKCDRFEDELFKWNCFDYALSRYSLFLFEILLEINEEITDKIDINTIIKRFHGNNKFIGSCCLYGYFRLLKLSFLDSNRNSDVQLMKIEVDVVNEKVYKKTTPLHLAAANGNTNIIELLLTKGCEINEVNEDNETPLHFACWFGTYNVVSKILQLGGDLNAVTNEKQTPLHLASANGKTEIIEVLTMEGCKINATDSDDYTALHFACLFGTNAAVIKILELGGDLNAITNEKQTPLHLAAVNGKTEIIDLLLKKGCKINATDEDNLTPLHCACRWGTYDAVIKILELGGDLNAVTNRKRTPLHLAAENDKTEIIDLLSKKGCKINATDKDNLTPLHFACLRGTYDAVIKILELGGNLNAVTNIKRTPLHLAAENDKTEIIDLLSKKGCKINATDEDNYTPLHCACLCGTYDAVIKILELGGDLNAVTIKKETPLHLASRSGNTNIIELLLEKGCKVNATDKDNATPLHFACRWGTYDAVIKILELGGDLNAVTNGKQTPLHLASANGKTEIIDLLSNEGCKINATDKDNLTPLHWACRWGTYDAVIKILELGGDFNAVTNEKQTPLHIASRSGNTNIIELLLEKGCKVNATDKDNATPLHIACRWGTYDAVIKILELGGDLNAVTNKKQTALHLALKNTELWEWERKGIVKYLLENGMNINALDDKNRTPLRCACDEKNYAIIEVLLENDAHLDAECRNILSQNLYDIFYHGKMRLFEILLQRLTNIEIKDALSHFRSEFPKHLATRDGHLQRDLLLKMEKLIEKYVCKMTIDDQPYISSKEFDESVINTTEEIPTTDNSGKAQIAETLIDVQLPVSSKEFDAISKNIAGESPTIDNSGKAQITEEQNENGDNDNSVDQTEYKLLMCAYYALKLCFDEKVNDFEITTNNEIYLDIRDVALKVTFSNKPTQTYRIQLKHKEQREIKGTNVLSTKNLIGYFESSPEMQNQDNISYIIFTNRQSEIIDILSEFYNRENVTASHNIQYVLIDDSDDEVAHIFNIAQNGQNSENFEDIFKYFYLFSNLRLCNIHDVHIDELLKERFGCEVDFIGFMRQWLKGKYVLNKHDVIVKLAELVLSPFIQEIPNNDNESLSEKAKLLKEAIMQFEMTLVKDCDVNVVAKIWMGETADLGMMSKASLKYGLSSTGLKDKDELASKEFTKLLWYLNKTPLIVKYDEKEEKKIRAAVDLLAMETDKKKLVLVGKKLEETISKGKALESLYDLRNTSFYEQIIAKFNVSLQERESISLKKLINSDTETAKLIEIKDLFLMLEKDLSIGKPLPNRPEPYISRTLKQDNSSPCEDEAFIVFNNPVNIVIGKPGNGKSTLMTSLCHYCPPEYWCVRVNLIEYSEFFRKKYPTEEIMNEFLKDEDSVLEKVKATFRRNKRIYLLLDGLDEIDANCVETVLTFIKDISSKGIRVWISSREHLKDKVSNYFKISPITIKELTKENQEEYIEQRLCHCEKSEGVIYTEEEVKEITRLFASVDVAYNAKNILGVPLLLFIITEIFRNDKWNLEKIIKEDIFVLTKMYKIFFQGMEERLHKNAGVQYKRPLGNRLNCQLKQYELAALQSLSSEFLPKLKLDSRELNESQMFLENIRDEGDPLGIISQVVSETNQLRAIFSRQSFAEYFACVWLKKNKEKLGLIKDSFFEDKNENLRLIFDIMLAEDKPLHLAVLYKNPDQVKKYINHYAEEDEGGRTALHLISSYCENYFNIALFPQSRNEVKTVIDLELLKLLSEKSTSLGNEEIFNWNCLDYALQTHSLLPFEVILEKHGESVVDIDKLIEHFDCFDEILQQCCYCGYSHLLKTLIHRYTSKNGQPGKLIEKVISGSQDKTETALIQKYSEILKTLVKCGITNGRTRYNGSVLHIAVDTRNEKIIKLLLEEDKLLADQTDYYKCTPLHRACQNGYYNVIETLLEMEVDVNALSSNNKKQTSLHIASKNGDTDIIELLLKKKANIKGGDQNKWTPLHYACFYGKYDAVIKILEFGGDLNAVTNKKQTILHLATKGNNIEIIQLLLKKGAKINEVDEDKWTALHYACFYGKYDTVKTIIESGADINAITNRQQTMLHLASTNKSGQGTNIVKYLLEQEMNINENDENNWTPLRCACEQNNYDVAEVLLENNALADTECRNILSQKFRDISRNRHLQADSLLDMVKLINK